VCNLEIRKGNGLEIMNRVLTAPNPQILLSSFSSEMLSYHTSKELATYGNTTPFPLISSRYHILSNSFQRIPIQGKGSSEFSGYCTTMKKMINSSLIPVVSHV
jgi:hypothetical protein